MPAMDDLPNVVVAPPAPPEPLPAAEPAELEAMPTPAVHDLVEAPPELVPTPAPAPTSKAAQAEPAPKAASTPAPARKTAAKPATAPKPAPKAAAPKAAAAKTAAPKAPAPKAHPVPEAAGSPNQAGKDDEAAVWLEELTLEAERAAADTSSEVLARAAAEAEQNLEDDEVWDEEPPESAGSPRPTPATSSDRRVVVIDEDSVIPVPEPAGPSWQGEPQTGGARVGATLEDDPTRKKRWRLFRKGGE